MDRICISAASDLIKEDLDISNQMMGFDIQGKPFGEGALPLEWMLGQLTEKCRTAILEQWTPPEANLFETIEKEQNWAVQSIAHLRQFITE